jgi:CHAT domain-containing protein
MMRDERGKALDRSISSLRGLANVVDHPATVLADLAAALIVRAERTQTPRDLLEAYATAHDAVRRDPRNRAALYNAALALDRFGLVDEAARAWRSYLAADSASEWAGDAQRRLEKLLAATAPKHPPAEDAPLTAYLGYAATDPQGARQLGMERLLGRWGEAVEAGKVSEAEAWLRRAAALGEALERSRGGDRSLAEAIRAISAVRENARALHSLARAHREYALGMALYDSSAYGRAEPRLAAVARPPVASPVLRAWAATFWGTTRVHNRAAKEGEQILRGVIAETDSRKYPSLAGRARWSLGNTLGRGERWEQGLEHARESARLFALAGERENEGAALNVVTYARFVLGESDEGYAAMHRALDRLRPYRASVRLRTLFTAGAPLIDTDGLFPAALCLQNEAVAIATRNGGTIQIVEARAARARLLAARGRATLAQADVLTARGLLPAIDDLTVRGWLQADLQEVEALASLGSDPAHATMSMDAAAAFFSQVPIRALPYVIGGAEARLAADDPAGAITRLERAIRMLDQRRDSIRMEPRRAAVYDAARSVIDRIVMLQLAAGRTTAALRYMDRGRASLAAAGAAAAEAERAVAAPPGEVAVEYALVGDTLLAWTVSGARVDLFRTLVDAAGLVRDIGEAESRLERRAPDAELSSSLAGLYDQLVRPLEGRLGSAGTQLIIVADGPLASVPFAALYDTRRGRYLVEDRPLRFSVSLREAWRAPTVYPASGVLLVADPAFDSREHPLLDRLPHAAGEVRAFAAGYPGARVLESDGATAAALRATLPRAGVAHFAGHAVFDDERPERSYLVLAPGKGVPGRITAAELAELDLRHVRVVVLAACRTNRSGQGRAAGFTGLSGALLAAGAGGAVGSTWDVDDRYTAELMARFHRQYQHAPDGPRALREAQLSLLRSGDSDLRSPSAWAGFRYAGR